MPSLISIDISCFDCGGSSTSVTHKSSCGCFLAIDLDGTLNWCIRHFHFQISAMYCLVHVRLGFYETVSRLWACTWSFDVFNVLNVAVNYWSLNIATRSLQGLWKVFFLWEENWGWFNTEFPCYFPTIYPYFSDVQLWIFYKTKNSNMNSQSLKCQGRSFRDMMER